MALDSTKVPHKPDSSLAKNHEIPPIEQRLAWAGDVFQPRLLAGFNDRMVALRIPLIVRVDI